MTLKEAIDKGIVFIKAKVTCSKCEGRGETYHTRACAEDDSTGWYQCQICHGKGTVEKMVPASEIIK